ncbi:unnamed protein product [Candida parapsilosis]
MPNWVSAFQCTG